ncbi:unnamed protein product [Absidia cylindrospora]
MPSSFLYLMLQKRCFFQVAQLYKLRSQEDSSNHPATIIRRRPDNSIVVLDGNCIDYSRGFPEVKSQSYANNPSSVGNDLIRLGVFVKNAIDVKTSKQSRRFRRGRAGMSGIYIGQNVTFYIMKLMDDGVYGMYEVGHFHVPGFIGQILQLTGYF